MKLPYIQRILTFCSVVILCRPKKTDKVGDNIGVCVGCLFTDG